MVASEAADTWTRDLDDLLRASASPTRDLADA